MRRFTTMLPALAIAFALAVVGCEGDQGPAGPPGPPGGTSEFTYLGGGGEACLHCHATTVGQWETTGHQSAYVDLDPASRNNLYCLQCHTVGFDSKVNFGDTQIAPGNRGPDENGFDDYVGVDTEEAAARRAELLGVQCESCHGPMGPDFNGHKPLISFSTHQENGEWTSLCYPCHETQLEEWVDSGHGSVQSGDIDLFNEEHYTHNPSCDGCHTSEGFIRDNDPRYASYEFPERQSFIGCVTCHDPHVGAEGGGNEYQLRTVGPVEVAYWIGEDPGEVGRPRMEGKGSGQVCAQCHHARRDNANVAGQIASGSGHMGPHSSPQMDMYIGAGSYEIPGYEYQRTHGHQDIGNACVSCHMVRVAEIHGESQEHAFHTFEPTDGNCAPCHTETSALSLALVKARQDAIVAKMNELAGLFGYATWEEFDANWNSRGAGVTTWQREAAYALYFVISDGSRGAHNDEYAEDLLQNAIDYFNSKKAMAALRP